MNETPGLFTQLSIRGVTFKNRIGVSPMCQYSSEDGSATDWHLVHLGSHAAGGASLVMVEATAVEARGRISPEDMGIWDDKHIEPLARIAKFVHGQGAVAAIQLAHAGRKAGTARPWEGGRPLSINQGAWLPVGPSAVPFSETHPVPHALSVSEMSAIARKFVEAAGRAIKAGFSLVELHCAHGYLMHSFLSPLSNKREDEYGGSLPNRMRFPLEIVEKTRAAIPATMPLFVRVSCTDWVEGAWDIEQSIAFAREAKARGADLIDCSSGGAAPHARIPVEPGYQVPFAEAIRARAGIASAAVGMITDPKQADDIIASGKADLVLLAREELRDPYWPLHAALKLGAQIDWPPQYMRAVR